MFIADLLFFLVPIQKMQSQKNMFSYHVFLTFLIFSHFLIFAIFFTLAAARVTFLHHQKTSVFQNYQ